MKICIIGGGISGLSAAYYLRQLQKDSEIQLLEASDRLGGSIETLQVPGGLLEKGAESLITDKPAALELIREIGLEEEIIATNLQFRKSFILHKNQLVTMPEGFYLLAPGKISTFLKTPLLSWGGKLRAAMDMIIPRSHQDDESLGSFVRRRLGQEVLDRIAQPMVAGIYSGDPEQISLKATMPQFLEMEEKYGSVICALKKRMKQHAAFHGAVSGPRYGLFVSLKTGLETLTRTLVSTIETSVTLQTQCRVKAVRFDKDHWVIEREKGMPIHADAVVLATPAYVTADLLAGFNREISDVLNKIPYANVGTINYLFKKEQIKHPLNGFGFVIPKKENKSFTACTLSSVKYEGRADSAHVLLRAYFGGVFGESSFELEDQVLAKTIEEELTSILKIQGRCEKSVIARYPQRMPQYTLGHLERVADIQSRAKIFRRLYLIGSAYQGVGISDCIQDGRRCAEAIGNETTEMSRLEPKLRS